ncbi:App1 family protein [Flagellimonas sp. 389]|uniref:phosphatase domain-containing protein n=1 Tax=Flagellimonas sp. 389 TaxID=2835862 RepID=UPI001BD510C1|nr:App1 family protein [Flagellimonas sp. 389]MBS9464279.1 App1 family protein [Flagellimonas sp. 389]
MLTDSTARMPLEGVQGFYTKLAKGGSDTIENPFFYLSNSPWNLHDYLQTFLKEKNLPHGPLLLRDIGLENKKKKSFLEGNKFTKISHILQTYPTLPFILIGDGEDLDPEIYLEIAKRFPDQVATIYIRSVSDKRKTKRIARLIKNFENVDIKLIAHTDEALMHAIEKGYLKL